MTSVYSCLSPFLASLPFPPLVVSPFGRSVSRSERVTEERETRREKGTSGGWRERALLTASARSVAHLSTFASRPHPFAFLIPFTSPSSSIFAPKGPVSDGMDGVKVMRRGEEGAKGTDPTKCGEVEWRETSG